jgi:hypothetical protein
MIQTLDCLTKTSLAQEFEDLIPEAKVVFKDHLIVSLVIIIPMVEDIHLFQTFFVPLDVFRGFFAALDNVTFYFSFAILPEVVDLTVKLYNFLLFVIV